MKFPGFDSSKEYNGLSGRPSKKYFNRIRNLIMLLTMFEIGLSTAEIIGLRWQDVNLPSGRLNVRRKAGRMEKEYLIDDDVLKILKRWRKYQARGTYYKALEFIFTDYEGKPLSRFFVYSLLFLWYINTFFPVKLVPDAPKDSGF